MKNKLSILLRDVGNQKGMTLIEVIVAMVIGLIITLGALQFYYAQHRSMVIQDKVTQMQANVRMGFRIMAEKMIEAGLDPNQANDANPNRFGFQPNLTAYPGGLGDTISGSTILWTQDDSGLTGPGAGTVDLIEVKGFRLQNNAIDQLRASGGNLAWKTFIGGIESLQFIYYDENGTVINPVTNFADIRRVRLTVVAFENINPDPALAYAGDIYRRTLIADIIPRNQSFD